MNQKTIILFVKYPEPGKVKTRLAKSIGFEKAAEIYQSLAEANVEVCGTTLSENAKTLIAFDPPEKEFEMKKWLSCKYHYFAQVGKGLGERLIHASEYALSQFRGPTLIVGSDTLELSKSVLMEAYRVLEEKDVVLGPARDGGYYLIGMKKHFPRLFKDIPWSTQVVLDKTIEKLNEMQLSYGLIKELSDLDEANHNLMEAIKHE